MVTNQMYRQMRLICKIASVQHFIEESNDKVSIPEIASFGDKKFIVTDSLYSCLIFVRLYGPCCLK